MLRSHNLDTILRYLKNRYGRRAAKGSLAVAHPVFLTFALALSLLAATASAGAKKESPTSYELVPLDPRLEVQVDVLQRVWAKDKPRGLAKLLPTMGALVLQPGRYRLEFGLRSGEKEWLLVPYVLRADGMERSPDSSMSVVSGCNSRFRRFLALDRVTREFASRVWRVQLHRCSNNSAETSVDGEWTQQLQFQEPGRVVIGGFRSIEEAVAAERADLASQAAAIAATRAAEAENVPLKRQIGARLCKTVGEWQFVGFTEAVSPDTGKVQIRLVDQLHVGAPSLRAGEFREQTLWDHPDLWTLCE